MPENVDPTHSIVMRSFQHPWTGGVGWVTEQYKSPDHESAMLGAATMVMKGWCVWIISNTGCPGFVVYREQNA